MYWLNESTNAKIAPLMMPGRTTGMVTLMAVSSSVAPRFREASSTDRGKFWRLAPMVRIG
jgi:hypothetical protein